MYFKILKGTESFDKLNEIFKRAKECRQAASKFATRYNEKGKYLDTGDSDILGGGLSFVFSETPIEGWVKDTKYKDAYRPRKSKANVEVIAEIKALPIVLRSEVNDVVKFEGGFIGNHYYYGCGVNYNLNKDFILISIPERLKDYKPTKDMIEILTSEFNKLEEELK